MSTLSQFGGIAPTKNIVNAHSSGGVATGVSIAASVSNNMREVVSGSLTANTLSSILSITGSGSINQLTAYAANATSRTVRCRVTVDGVVVFDATSSSVAGLGFGLIVVGSVQSGGQVIPGNPIRFNASLTVEVASSLTETGGISIGYNVART